MAFGVTDDGFVKKRLEDIKSELEADYQSVYGSDLDVSDESVAGQEIATLSGNLADIWDALEAVYSSQDPGSASGISFDRVAQLIAVRRIGASKSSATCSARGTEGTFLASGQQVSQQDTDELFSSTTDVTITESGAVLEADVSVTSVYDIHLYTITINSTVSDFTSDGTATELEILTGLRLAIIADSEPVTVTISDDNTQLLIESDDGLTTFTITVSTDLDIDEVGVELDVLADDFGSTSVPADTLINIETPVAGWDSVNNLIAGTTGTDQETDEAFRARRRLVTQATGAATPEAIRNYILDNVDGVTAATVTENRTDITDGDGRPPHSFEAVVTGGIDQEIADAIWESGGAGIQTFGGESETVTDSQGVTHSIFFSRPTPVDFYVYVVYTLYSEEVFPTNGEQLIKDAIVAFGLTEYTVAQDVIPGRLNTPVYSVEGVGDVTVYISKTVTPSFPGDYTTSTIAVAGSEQAVVADARITLDGP